MTTSLELELQSLVQSRNKLDQKIQEIHKQIIEKREMQNAKVADDDIKKLLEITPQYESRILYERLNKYLEQYGLRSSGYFPDTNQRSVQFAFYATDDIDLIEEGLNKVIPFLKPLPKIGRKIVDFMEPTLSEYGTWNLQIADKYYINKTTYGRSEDIKTFDTLREALEYIEENHNMEDDG